jgi:RimJ/RimL family protein N-acetyltransferase
LRALLDLGFGELGAHRVYAKVYPGTVASQRLLEKIGFRREGHQVKDTFVRGAWEDSLLYAMLEEE